MAECSSEQGPSIFPPEGCSARVDAHSFTNDEHPPSAEWLFYSLIHYYMVKEWPQILLILLILSASAVIVLLWPLINRGSRRKQYHVRSRGQLSTRSMH